MTTPARILALAIKSAKGGPMLPVDSAEVLPATGLRGPVASRPGRAVTFLSQPQWQAVRRELGVDLPWHTRRANVLLDLPDLLPLIGRVLAVGTVRVKILNETKPCDMMDALHPGLQAALRPAGRGGVYGMVLAPGRLHVGDEVVITADPI